jgi:hypothetical protein
MEKSSLRLMEILAQKKISKARLSRLFSKSDPTAQRWFRGEQCPEVKPWVIFEVADQLEIDPRDLAFAIKEAYESAKAEQDKQDEGDRP